MVEFYIMVVRPYHKPDARLVRDSVLGVATPIVGRLYARAYKSRQLANYHRRRLKAANPDALYIVITSDQVEHFFEQEEKAHVAIRT